MALDSRTSNIRIFLVSVNRAVAIAYAGLAGIVLDAFARQSNSFVSSAIAMLLTLA